MASFLSFLFEKFGLPTTITLNLIVNCCLVTVIQLTGGGVLGADAVGTAAAIEELKTSSKVAFNQLFIVDFHAIDFNWTRIDDRITYKLIYEDYPDLPESFHFIDTGKGNAYLYGVLNKSVEQYRSLYKFDLIAVNWYRNEVRKRAIVLEPVDLNSVDGGSSGYDDDSNDDLLGSQAWYEIYLKIDNLDVVSVLDRSRLNVIKQVFASLWNNNSSLTVTYFETASSLGARLPLNPNDGQGVVMKLASKHPFSQQMLDLEQEVKPLWKLTSCPRNYKRTSVEIQFRRHNLMLDWCKFRLIKNERLPSKYSSVKYPSVNPVRKHGFLDAHKIPTKSYLASFAKISIYLIIFFMAIVYLLHFVMFRNQNHGDGKKMDIFKSIYLAKTVSEKQFELSKKDKEEIYATLKSNTDTLYSVSKPNTLTRRCIN